jgi:hypothetical protein
VLLLGWLLGACPAPVDPCVDNPVCNPLAPSAYVHCKESSPICREWYEGNL